jgi:hypothetical protein
MLTDGAFAIVWRTDAGERLTLHANLGAEPVPLADQPLGQVLFRHPAEGSDGLEGALPAGSVVLSIDAGRQNEASS